MNEIKIVVISDTHGEIDSIKKIRQLHPNANMFLHCGDSELPVEQIDGFAAVKGNCDYFDYPLFRNIKTELGNIYLEHGHCHTLTDEYIFSKNAVIFLFGHTHRKYYKLIGNCHVANPGSLSRSRDGDKGSYLLITLSKNKIDFQFKELE